MQFGLRFGQAIASATGANTINPRCTFTGAIRDGNTITVSATLLNGGSLMTAVPDAQPQEFRVSEDGITFSRYNGTIPFTAALIGNTVVLTKTTGVWAAGTKVQYLNGYPCAVGSASYTQEKALLDGLLYESRADAVPSGITGLPVGVPLMPTWADLVAA